MRELWICDFKSYRYKNEGSNKERMKVGEEVAYIDFYEERLIFII